MQNEGTELEPKGKPVLTRILIPLAWTFWGVLLIVLLYGLIRVSTEGRGSPEAGPGLGIFTVLFLLALLAVAAVFLNRAARKQSPAGLITMTVILAWPVVGLVADPAIKAYKRRSYASNDLLAYSLVLVREKGGKAAPVRVLLDVGADPRTTRMGSGEAVVNYLLFANSFDGHEAMRLVLEHGADPNVFDAERRQTPIGTVYNDPEIVHALVDHGADLDRIQSDGTTALVGFISTRQWESALYLIEKGANLDVKNSHGVSVDYYLEEWKDSVLGEHPEGWARVREAIAKRRGVHK
jgi:hypothetical protein